MTTLIETIQLRGAAFVIDQGTYNLTADAMRLRGQQPLYAGDDYLMQLTLKDPSGVVVPITGWAIKMTVRFSALDGVAASFTKSASIVDGPNGRFDIAIARTDWPGPNLRFGKYDVQRTITLAGPTYDTSTLLSGDIEFLPNITQAVP